MIPLATCLWDAGALSHWEAFSPQPVKKAAGARDPLQDLVSSQAMVGPDRRIFFPRC